MSLIYVCVVYSLLVLIIIKDKRKFMFITNGWNCYVNVPN